MNQRLPCRQLGQKSQSCVCHRVRFCHIQDPKRLVLQPKKVLTARNHEIKVPQLERDTVVGLHRNQDFIQFHVSQLKIMNVSVKSAIWIPVNLSCR